jgi:hypothetical protein
MVIIKIKLISMEIIEMNLNYAGASIMIKLYPEVDFRGMIYPVEIDGHYAFTLHFNEEQDWLVIREPDGTTPFIESDLFEKIIKKLEYQLRYAA